MAELVYAADLKSAGLNNLVGSSPTRPTTFSIIVKIEKPKQNRYNEFVI